MEEYVYTKDGRKLYTKLQVADLVGRSVQSINYAVQSGKLRHHTMVGLNCLYTEEEAMNFSLRLRRYGEERHPIEIKDDILHPSQKEFLECLSRGEPSNISTPPRNGTTFVDKLNSSSFNECLERELSSAPVVSNVRRIAQGIRESFDRAFKGDG